MVHNVKKFTIFWSSNCDVVPWSFFSIKNLGSLNGPSVGINVEKPVIFSIVVDEVSREKKKLDTLLLDAIMKKRILNQGRY